MEHDWILELLDLWLKAARREIPARLTIEAVDFPNVWTVTLTPEKKGDA